MATRATYGCMNTPMSSTPTIFLDIDGVVADLHGLNPIHVENLNWLVENATQPVQIVTNTAWNTLSVEEFRDAFVAKGFRYPDTIVDKTDACEGGGAAIRRWLAANNFASHYVIIDDTTFGGVDDPRSYHGMWGRLVHTNGQKDMFGLKEREQARRLLWRGIPLSCETERQAALTSLETEVARIRNETPWLTDEQRETAARKTWDMAFWVLWATPDKIRAKSCLAIPHDY